MKNDFLSFKNVSLFIKGNTNPILHNITYSINEHDFVMVLGSNGSGKSSLLKLLIKQYLPSEGKILLLDKPLEKYKEIDLYSDVKILTQNVTDSLFNTLTILENYLILSYQKSFKAFKINSRLERNFLSNYLKNFNNKLITKLDQPIQYLSGGEKQTLALALTMLIPPRLLLLDEHTAALDPKTARNLMQLTNDTVKKYQITCLLTTHNVNEALQYGNKILALNNGNIHQTFAEKEKSMLQPQDILSLCYQ